jgi:protein-histidine pros-kinase
MQALVKEGLAYARSLDERQPAQPIDLDGLLSALRADAQDMGWQVAVSGTAQHVFSGQPTALRRALWNLIENGVKFGERVDVRLDEDPNGFRIRIRDHGAGLAEAELEKVFEPFYRTESSRSRETGGTGLGLAIARNLLRAQRGEVKLGNHPDGGLEATVWLPMHAPGHLI